eukprot:gnl/TRDRNA2_/TRDRNA2_208829_c0_seq1.p2 gnl/TRDRNA2_/TRDRNA2_208829_c0~~gnl/TRDRNA2_/TRDRNA2_208829_c0_seq1.p2  ORF type:complete len:116 (+),score=18.06 gnl/TRDRNA2_/TRDRNA2_208829_c0_seq1:219-566(+)
MTDALVLAKGPPLLADVAALEEAAPEVAAAVPGMSRMLVCFECAILLGYVGAARHIAWEMSPAVPGMFDKFVLIDKTFCFSKICATTKDALEIKTSVQIQSTVRGVMAAHVPFEI